MADQPPIPAATLIVMRDVPGGPPELLMAERGRALAFAGGALVFPGGRVDPGDRALAAAFGGDVEETASKIAAIRETLEEAGLAIGLPGVSPGQASAVRARLHAGDALGEALAPFDVLPTLDRLTPFARWLPRDVAHRIFDTRFYLAVAPERAAASSDGNETARVFWASAQSVLEEADAGRATIIYPTRRNLERLATLPSHAAAVAHARAIPPMTITPWIETRDGVPHLCIPEDAGYPVTSEPLDQALRA